MYPLECLLRVFFVHMDNVHIQVGYLFGLQMVVPSTIPPDPPLESPGIQAGLVVQVILLVILVLHSWSLIHGMEEY